MRPLSTRSSRIAGLLAVILGAVAFMAMPGIAAAQHHGAHARQHHRHHGRHAAHSSSIQAVQESGGTITSYDASTGKLTIALAEGESVTGLVTEETEINCEGTGQSGDDGQQGPEPGDDNGGAQGQQSGGGDSGGAWWGDSEGKMGEDPMEGTCGTESLTPGTAVGSAELQLEGGKLVFEEIDLGTGTGTTGTGCDS